MEKNFKLALFQFETRGSKAPVNSDGSFETIQILVVGTRVPSFSPILLKLIPIYNSRIGLDQSFPNWC